MRLIVPSPCPPASEYNIEMDKHEPAIQKEGRVRDEGGPIVAVSADVGGGGKDTNNTIATVA